MKTKIAIACQGGGSQAAFTAGVFKALFENNIQDKFEIVSLSGTSGGGVCAALIWYALKKAVKVSCPTTDHFFTDSQRQFNESQKKLAELWDESQKQLSESQKKLVYTWIDNLPKGTIQADVFESFEKALNFQRDLVNSTLNAQQVAFQLVIETQKQFWDNYFQITQRKANTTQNTTVHQTNNQ